MAKKPTKRTPDDEFDVHNLQAGAVPMTVGLTDEEKAAIEKDAADQIAGELAERERAIYHKAALVRARIAAGLLPPEADDEEVRIKIDLAKYANHIMLDGRVYYHGYTYVVPLRVCRVLLEQCSRSHAHQDEVDGRSRFEAYQRPRLPMLGKRALGGPTA